MKLKFIKYNDDVEIPVRKHYSDTGADIYMLSDGIIFPHQTLVIPLGFGIHVPNGYSARLQVRTSVAKHGLYVHGCAIDANYTGEISMILMNLGNEIYNWNKDDRLAYIEVYPTVYPDFVENFEEERGQNAFGSTGK